MRSQVRKLFLGGGATLLSALLLSAGLGGAAGAAVSARSATAHHHHGAIFFQGTVASVSASTTPQSFTVLRGNDTSITVDVSSTTTYSAKGLPATFSSVATGDRVIVTAQRTATDGIVEALHVGLLG